MMIRTKIGKRKGKRIYETELFYVKGNKAKGKSREAFVTAEIVRNTCQGIGCEYGILLKAFDKENDTFKKRVGKDRGMSTYRARVRAEIM